MNIFKKYLHQSTLLGIAILLITLFQNCGTPFSSTQLATVDESFELPGPSQKLHMAHPYYTCVHNRYVATSAHGGSDSNDGTSPTNQGNGVGPWLTLTKANNSLPNPAPGYCVNVADGNYPTSFFQINKGGNLSSTTGYVVYRSTNLLGAKLVSNGGGGMVQIYAPYVIMDGFEVDGKRNSNVQFGIDSCYGTAGSYNGVHHILLFNNYIHDVGGNGIGLCWAEYYWVIHNRTNNNAYLTWNSGISTYQPIQIPNYIETEYDRQFTPYHNIYAYNRSHGNFTLPENGPHTDGNGLIYDDTRHWQIAPYTEYTPKALIMGNLMTNNGGAGIQIGPASANADVFNNTCYNNYRDTLNDATWRGELSANSPKNVTFKNNIGIAVPGSGVRTHATPFLGAGDSEGSTWSNNIAYGANVNIQSPNTFPLSTNQRNTNPLLVNINDGNFALCADVNEPTTNCTGISPAIGAGTVVPYWQQQTPGQIDIGACPSGARHCN